MGELLFDIYSAYWSIASLLTMTTNAATGWGDSSFRRWVLTAVDLLASCLRSLLGARL